MDTYRLTASCSSGVPAIRCDQGSKPRWSSDYCNCWTWVLCVEIGRVFCYHSPFSSDSAIRTIQLAWFWIWSHQWWTLLMVCPAKVRLQVSLANLVFESLWRFYCSVCLLWSFSQTLVAMAMGAFCRTNLCFKFSMHNFLFQLSCLCSKMASRSSPRSLKGILINFLMFLFSFFLFYLDLRNGSKLETQRWMNSSSPEKITKRRKQCVCVCVCVCEREREVDLLTWTIHFLLLWLW